MRQQKEQHDTKGQKGKRFVSNLKNGETLYALDGIYLIQTSPNTFRGVDEKYDTEALNAISFDKSAEV